MVYKITYKCGHTYNMEFEKDDNVENRVKHEESLLCQNCYSDKIREENAEAAKGCSLIHMTKQEYKMKFGDCVKKKFVVSPYDDNTVDVYVPFKKITLEYIMDILGVNRYDTVKYHEQMVIAEKRLSEDVFVARERIEAANCSDIRRAQLRKIYNIIEIYQKKAIDEFDIVSENVLGTNIQEEKSNSKVKTLFSKFKKDIQNIEEDDFCFPDIDDQKEVDNMVSPKMNNIKSTTDECKALLSSMIEVIEEKETSPNNEAKADTVDTPESKETNDNTFTMDDVLSWLKTD